MKSKIRTGFLFVRVLLLCISISKCAVSMSISSNATANEGDYTQFLLATCVARTPPMGY